MPNPAENLSASQALLVQLWNENPIFRQVLGICSALAVTNRMVNTLLMCIGLIWAAVMSSLTASLLRNYTPQRIRIMVSVLIIAVYVICVDIAMRAFFPDVQREIAAYVGLIVTNCIVLGRVEAFASKNPPLPSAADALGAGLGYSAILMIVALIREVLGFGTIFGLPLGGFTQFWIDSRANWIIMIMPPGAFFVLACVVWAARSYALKTQARAAEKGAS